jgi:hypothetical protein
MRLLFTLLLLCQAASVAVPHGLAPIVVRRA